MNKYRFEKNSLTSVADKIREKYSITDELCFPDDFAEAILNNSILQRSSTEDFIEGSMTEVVSNATKIKPYAFCNNMTSLDLSYNQVPNPFISVNLPIVDSVDQGAFFNCTSLTTVNCPKLTVIGDMAFTNCASLVNINIPNVSRIGDTAFRYCIQLTSINFSNLLYIGGEAFSKCSSLSEVNCPLVTEVSIGAFTDCESLTNVSLPSLIIIAEDTFKYCNALQFVNFPNVTTVGRYAFDSCPSLTTVDFSNITNIDVSAFRNCTSLTALILRNTETVCSTSCDFSDMPIGQGTGYIYVPAALIEQYKTASGWSSYAAQFRALEDYTVDGTTTGALDETKI